MTGPNDEADRPIIHCYQSSVTCNLSSVPEESLLGEGILKGLAETAKNFAGSFVSSDRLTTVEYPEQRIPTAENARVFPFLVYDGTDWESGLRCVACQICEKECPPKCIYIDKSK